MESITRNLITILLVTTSLCANGINPDDDSSGENRDNSTVYEDSVSKLALLLAKAGRTEEANAEFQKLPSYGTDIDKVVTELYDGDITHTSNTLDTLYSISCTVYANGISTLFRELWKPEENATQPELFLFAQLLQGTGCAGNELISQISEIVTPYIEKTFDQMAEDIRKENFTRVHPFMNPKFNKVYKVESPISELIRKTMADNSTSFNSIMSFVKDQRYFVTLIQGYRTIIDELKERGKLHSEEMLLIAYWIHHDLTKRNADKIANSANLATPYSQLKADIPSEIRDIFWKSKCSIYNDDLEQYLGAAVENRVATAVTRKFYDSRLKNQDDWVFEPMIMGGKLHFHVKNDRMPNTANLLCEWRRRCCSEMCSARDAGAGGDTKWTLIPAASNKVKTAFLLRRGSGEDSYLQSIRISYDGYSLDKGSRQSQISYWSIRCTSKDY